jgi:hypothetical protein
MIDWFVHTLRSYPEIAIFLSLALGYYFGSFTYKSLGLGAVTATLIAAVIIGQLGITISGPLKPTFFMMFLFAIGYAVGPQFVRGIAQDGIPQALFARGCLRVLSVGSLVDFEFWARKNIGDETVEYLKKNIHALDLAFRLAKAHGIVLLNGGGFAAPDWSPRVSLANLPDEAYERRHRTRRTGDCTGPSRRVRSVKNCA